MSSLYVVNRLQCTQICIERLEEKFPKSPRVDALQGLLLEKESALKAKTFYESRLKDDENNVVRSLYLFNKHKCSRADLLAISEYVSFIQLVRKRLIALHLHTASFPSSEANEAGLSVQKGIAMLVEHLDTVYNDTEGWSELTSAYEKLGL